ncbi:MAG: hypothetical protein QM764_22365 [Chitinophagaceae bacterium]
MKYILFMLAIGIAGCIQHAQADIEGIYTRESASEYSRAWDTLVIIAYDLKAATYLIRRKTGFIRINKGVPLTKQWKDDKMMTKYNQANNQLVDSKTGRVFSFSDNSLMFGTAMYRKVASSQ